MRKAAAPASTGGAGTIFEYQAAAIMLSHLLAGTHPPGLPGPVTRVGLQQRSQGHLLDDIVIYGGDGDGALCTEFQVKKQLTVTAGDREFAEIVRDSLFRIGQIPSDILVDGTLALGVIAGGDATALAELDWLVQAAQSHDKADSFYAIMVKGVTSEKRRRRLSAVKSTVATAIANGAPDLGDAATTTHAFLASLHVWHATTNYDGQDFRAAMDRLRPVAGSFGVTSLDLFGHLAVLAQQWGPFAGAVGVDQVKRRLRRRGLRIKGSGSASAEIQDIDLDAVIRGPIVALGLDEQLEEADKLVAAQDSTADQLLAGNAQKLDAAKFPPHAAMIRRRQASALQKLSRAGEAQLLRIEVAWGHLEQGQIWEAGFAMGDGHQQDADFVVPEAIARAAAVADAATWVAKGDPSMADLVEAFDALQAEDTHRDRAAAMFAEHALARGEDFLIMERRSVLAEIAESALRRRDTTSAASSARILMCVADASGDWANPMRTFSKTYPTHVRAWAAARYGRHLAINGDGPGAQDLYLLAIERACENKMFDDAADWLYALRTVRYWYDDDGRDEQHPTAQALRTHAIPSALPGGPHLKELAQHAALGDGEQEALLRVMLWRWQTVVRAGLTDEIAATKILAMLHERYQRPVQALELYVKAGAKDEACRVAKALPDAALAWDAKILGNPIMTLRATAYAATTAASDLISDDDLARAGTAALTEISQAADIQDRNPAIQEAYGLLAVAVAYLSNAQAAELDRHLTAFIDDPRRLFGVLCETIASIAVGLCKRNPDATPTLVKALLADSRMAGTILAESRLLKERREQLSMLLSPNANTNIDAALALAIASADPVLYSDLAHATVERAIQEIGSTATDPTDSGFTVALLAKHLPTEKRDQLASMLAQRALDASNRDATRYNDLSGLAALASNASHETCQVILQKLLGLLNDAGTPSNTDGRVDFTLLGHALRAAAKLATSREHHQALSAVGDLIIQVAPEPKRWRIAGALNQLTIDTTIRHLEIQLGHPSAPIRALRATRATKQRSIPANIAEVFARDADHNVRREFAEAINENLDIPTEVLAILHGDPRRSVRSALKAHPG